MVPTPHTPKQEGQKRPAPKTAFESSKAKYKPFKGTPDEEDISNEPEDEVKKMSEDTTEKRYKDPNTGLYTPERNKMHEDAIDEIIKDAGDPPPGEKPLLIFMGGGSASGKSTLRKKLLLPALKRSGRDVAVVDADDIKERFIPEYKGEFAKADPDGAAYRSHEESSDIADAAIDTLFDQGKNFIYDGTMKSPAKYKSMIKKAREKGYEVQIMIADVSLPVAYKRNLSRYQKEGRYVPKPIINQSHGAIPTSFDDLKDLVDDYALFDTNRGRPALFHSKEYTHHERLQQFYRKKQFAKKKE
jgi:predicted ABC-type ATPase